VERSQREFALRSRLDGRSLGARAWADRAPILVFSRSRDFSLTSLALAGQPRPQRWPKAPTTACAAGWALARARRGRAGLAEASTGEDPLSAPAPRTKEES